MSHAYLQSASVCPGANEPGAMERLSQTDARLRSIVARTEKKLRPLLPPPVNVACSPPQNPCATPVRTPLGQLVHEMNIAIALLENTIDRIDL